MSNKKALNPFSRCRLGFILAALAVTLLIFPTPQVQACNCDGKNADFWILLNQIIAILSAPAGPGGTFTQSQRNAVENRIRKICSLFQSMDSKLKDMPGWVPPFGGDLTSVLSYLQGRFPGLTSPPFNFPPPGPPPSGGGRGGGLGGGSGVGGGNGLPGDVVPMIGWARNNQSIPCDFDWLVVADPNNVAGFTVSLTAGNVAVAPTSIEAIPFDVTIAPGVPPGTVAFFDILFTDGCSGLPLTDESSRFRVTAASDITITPSAQFVQVPPWGPFSVSWTVTNNTNTEVTKSFSFVMLEDPASIAVLNDGTPYDIRNVFQDDKSITGGSITLAPNSSITVGPGPSADIQFGPLRVGEFCQFPMIGWCGLQIDDLTSTICHFNNDKLPPDQSVIQGPVPNQIQVGQGVSLDLVATWASLPVPNVIVEFTKIGGDFTFTSGNVSSDGGSTRFSRQAFYDLIGTSTGGAVDLVISGPYGSFPVQVPTFVGDTVEQIVDRLAQEMLNLADTQDGFNFMPIVESESIMILRAPDTTMNLSSSDPGLQWVLDGSEVETDANGVVTLIFAGDAPGPGLIKATIPGTELTTYSFFEIVAPPSPLMGDIDGDGVVDGNDTNLFIAVLLGTDTDPAHVAASDCNGDGALDGKDIQAFANSFISP